MHCLQIRPGSVDALLFVLLGVKVIFNIFDFQYYISFVTECYEIVTTYSFYVLFDTDKMIEFVSYF